MDKSGSQTVRSGVSRRLSNRGRQIRTTEPALTSRGKKECIPYPRKGGSRISRERRFGVDTRQRRHFRTGYDRCSYKKDRIRGSAGGSS